MTTDETAASMRFDAADLFGAADPPGEVRHEEACRLLAGLDESSVPMIFADPPYGIGYHSNHHKGKNPHAPVANDWNFNIGRFLTEAGRVLTDGGAMYLCCRWDVMPMWVQQVAPPLKIKSAVVWIKDNHSAGDLQGAFGNQYEMLLFLVKGRHLLRGRRWSNVWNFPRVPAKQSLHPTQKPVALVERAILASTDSGDLVVDPFSGSGSTAVAARMAGRPFLTGDVDPAMVALTQRRLGWPVTVAVDEEAAVAPQSIYEMQVEHAFGCPSDELRWIASELERNSAAVADGAA